MKNETQWALTFAVGIFIALGIYGGLHELKSSLAALNAANWHTDGHSYDMVNLCWSICTLLVIGGILLIVARARLRTSKEQA